MKEIKRFENNERLVKLIYNVDSKEYTVLILTNDGKSKGKIYKSKKFAERKFLDYKNNPLKSLRIK